MQTNLEDMVEVFRNELRSSLGSGALGDRRISDSKG